jgi:Spy/CpxP family protein refolding chaperone
MSENNNNRWLSIATLVLLVANIITLTLLWTHNRPDVSGKKRPEPPGQVFEFLTKELQLTSQQQLAYKQLRDLHRTSQHLMQDSIRIAKDELFSFLNQPNVSDSQLREYSEKVTAYVQQLDMITFRHFQKLRELCDPDQQKKFDEIIKEALGRMGGQGRKPSGPGNHPPAPGRNEDPPPIP